MSILDTDIIEKANNSIDQIKREEEFWNFMLSGSGARGIEVENNFIAEVLRAIDGFSKVSLDKNIHRHIGRQVYEIDCGQLCKYDAIGWLKAISTLPLLPKPILIVKNITDIPDEDINHDNPEYVRNLLLHSWKNQTNQFTDNRPGQHNDQFIINSHDYLVFITWQPEKKEKIEQIWNPSDNLAIIGNFEKLKKDW